MNPMKLILAAMAGVSAGACSNEYYFRSDSIRFEAGDAVATNLAVQIPNPRPPRSQDTNIPMDAVKAQKAIEKYRNGDQKQGGGMMIPVVDSSNGSPFESSINGNK
ncbi:hypothetical protein ACNHKD_12975 [Methylocystis sp. JAN1]|uniref:hypothetical protein n=1 Tax=Methylocystis sp. JAN1 TaxID=3397211 RepID=UPI003FA2704A